MNVFESLYRMLVTFSNIHTSEQQQQGQSMLLTVYIEWDIIKPSKNKVCTIEQQHVCAYMCVELLLCLSLKHRTTFYI